MQECTTVLFHRKKKERTITQMQGRHVIENLFLLFEVLARGHACTWASKHTSDAWHVST